MPRKNSLVTPHFTKLLQITVKMAMPQMDESKMKMVQDLEIEMMTDMYEDNGFNIF